MIELIFFNEALPIDDAAKSIFSAIGIQNNILEGDSAHVLSGIYYSYSIFGLKIKLELNSYDYDDKYNYMISVREDSLSHLIINDDIIKNTTSTILDLLLKNRYSEIAYEVATNNLKVFSR